MSLRCAHCGRRAKGDPTECPSCGSIDLVADAAPEATPPAPPAARAAPARRSPVVALLAVAAVGGVGIACGVGALVASRILQPAPTPADGGFGGLRAAGRFVVAADPEAPPFLSAVGDGYEGFEYALARAIAGEAGVPLEIRAAGYGELLDLVARGEVDAAVGQIPPQGHGAVAFTRSYLQYHLCVVVPAASPARGLLDLGGERRIGVYDDPTAEAAIAAEVGGAWARVVYEDYGYFADLEAGRLDAVVYDCPLVRHELARRPQGLRVADASLGVGTYSVAVSSDRPALRADIDRVLGELGDKGLLQQLAARWLGEDPTEDAARPSPRFVVVRAGETLEQTAARILGDPARASDLHAWNQDILGSERGAVYPGMKLRVR